jgi:ectoine hydrolase
LDRIWLAGVAPEEVGAPAVKDDIKRELLFSQAEYQQRLERVRTAMAQSGVDALVVFDPNNIYYVTGYRGISHYVPQGLIVTGDRLAFVLREMDLRGALLTTALDDSSVFAYGDDILMSADRSPYHFLAERVLAFGLAGKRVGLDKSGGFISPASWEVFVGALRDIRVVDTTLLINRVRARKSPAEIGFMREAGRISDAAILAGVDAIAPGVRECDAAAEVTKRLVGGTPEAGGGMAYPPMMPAGHKVSTPHLIWSDDRYGADSQVNMEVGAMRHWYVSPASRTAYLGKPPAALRKLESATVAGMHAALEAVRPGVTCEEIEAAFRRETSRHGFEKKSRIGYAVGLGFLPPGWIEMTSSLAPGDRTVMQTGMTYHLMLGMWFDAQSLVMSESFVVTEQGHESFSKLKRQIYVRD